tara:strand:- start:2341 stop:2499 length:159 start_codon:yes stop_codon:yes gene_type:complete
MILQTSAKDNAKTISKMDCDCQQIHYLFIKQLVLQDQLLKHKSQFLLLNMNV